MSILVPSLRSAVAVPGWAKNELWRKARAVPSLDLRFAENKSLVDATTGANLVTFTRASSGTYVGSDGLIKTATTDVPRFDHNPTTGESLGLLVEESRTNYILYSEAILSNVVSGPYRTILQNAEISPDGTTTAASVTATGTDPYVVVNTATGVSAGTYTFSVYLKGHSSNSSQNCKLRVQDAGSGLKTSNNFAITTDWQRYDFTVTTTGNLQNVRLDIPDVAVSGDIVYVWGLQIEEGSFPTSYIPTTGTTATRAADVASITGTNFSSWYRQDEGTVFADVDSSSITSGRILQIGDGTSNNRQDLLFASGPVNYFMINGGSGQTNMTTFNSATTGQLASIAAGYETNNMEVVLNSGLVVTDDIATVPIVDQMGIGRRLDVSAYLNGHIRRITYWPQRLPNTTLQTITQ